MKHSNKKILGALSLFAGLVWVSTNCALAAELECKGIAKHVIDTDLQFSLTHSQFPGELAVSKHRLRVLGSQYTLESVSQAKGLLAVMYSGQLTQKSEGLVDAQYGLAPMYYAEQRGKKPVAETVLNMEMQQIQFKRNGETTPLEKGLQDRISMVYQIAARLRCKNNLKTGDKLTMRVMSTGRVSNEVFILQKAEDVTLKLGEGNRSVSTLLFETMPENAGDEIVRIWYAKDLNWQPVIVQIQSKEGKTLTQTLIGTETQKP